MVIQTEMRFLDCRQYDKKDKATGNKTGEKGNILQLLEVNDEGRVSVGTYFPADDQLQTKDGITSVRFMDKVQVTMDLASATAKPRFVSLGDVVQRADIGYHAVGEIKEPINREKKAG